MTEPITQNHLVLLPVLLPMMGAVLGLLVKKKRRIQGQVALAAMLMSLMATAGLCRAVSTGTDVLVFYSGGWKAPFGICLVADPMAVFFVIMSQLVLVAGILYALQSIDKAVGYPAFFPMYLFLATALSGAFLTGDIFNLFVFAELLVISGTVLTAVSDDGFGPEAAFKYFYISQLAAIFLLIAVGCLYVGYGTLNMADLAARIAADGRQPLLLPAIAFLLAAFAIKSAAFPFHFWQPDFHTAAPTAVSAILSSVVVKFGVYGFIRMTTLLFVAQSEPVRQALGLMGLSGILFGGLCAIGTHNVKRMLAYSTLAQVGFILLGLSWGTPLTVIAALVFAFHHSLIKAALLMLAGYVASRAPVKSAAFTVVTGVGHGLPLGGVLFFIGGLALAGIPPTNGFISKMLLFSSGIAAEQGAMLLVIGLFSILTLIYVNRAFQRIWWQVPDERVKTKQAGDSLLAPLLLILLVVLTGIWSQPLIAFAQQAVVAVENPAGYIGAVLP